MPQRTAQLNAVGGNDVVRKGSLRPSLTPCSIQTEVFFLEHFATCKAAVLALLCAPLQLRSDHK